MGLIGGRKDLGKKKSLEAFEGGKENAPRDFYFSTSASTSTITASTQLPVQVFSTQYQPPLVLLSTSTSTLYPPTFRDFSLWLFLPPTLLTDVSRERFFFYHLEQHREV